jgi:Rod binding domain-containing protein
MTGHIMPAGLAATVPLVRDVPRAAVAGGSGVGAFGNAPLSDAQTAKIWKAAQDFEASAIGQLLAPMFDTVDTANGAFGGGSAEDAWKPMLVDAIGKQIAAHGGFGLAAPIYAALLRVQEGKRT